MPISVIKDKYEQETGIAKEDCILKNSDGEIMEDQKTLIDYDVLKPNGHIL